MTFNLSTLNFEIEEALFPKEDLLKEAWGLSQYQVSSVLAWVIQLDCIR